MKPDSSHMATLVTVPMAVNHRPSGKRHCRGKRDNRGMEVDAKPGAVSRETARS